MKKNIIVSIFAGTLLIITACATQSAGQRGNNNQEVSTLEDAKVPLDAQPEEMADFLSGLDEIKPSTEGNISNGLFSVNMPKSIEGTYIAYSSLDSIYVYDKDAKDAGFGGFVFRISAYKDPKDYAGGLAKKVGEMTLSDGTVYDVTREDPSDVQWDYTNNQKTPESYSKILDSFDTVIATLKPFDTGSFVLGAGMKGEDLYGDELAIIRTAIEEHYDAKTLESMGLSSMYYAISQAKQGNTLEQVGYTFADVNFDGIDELLVGEIAKGDMKGAVYDMYTMIDRKPVHVLSGYARDRYYIKKGGMVINEASGGANTTTWTMYNLEPNTTSLFFQYALKYDNQENEENPYYINYDPTSEVWEAITVEDFNMYKDRFDYNRFEFTPFA